MPKKIKPFDTNLFLTMNNLANRRVSLKCNNSVWVQKNSYSLYSNFILNLYIVYELDNLPRNYVNNFTLNMVDFLHSNWREIRAKFLTCNGQGITFDGKSIWSFDNVFARNVVNFGVDNTSSSHINNQNNNCSVLGEGSIEGNINTVGSAEKN